MNVSLVASPAGSLPPVPQNGSRQQAQHLNAIANALQVGDFDGAQRAFAAFQQASPTGEKTTDSQAGSARALENALKAADWSASAQAFRALRQEIQNSRKPIQAQPQKDGQNGDAQEQEGANSANAQGATSTPQVGSRLDVTV